MVQGDMTQSDTGFTTWSQLKKSNDHIHMHRLVFKGLARGGNLNFIF